MIGLPDVSIIDLHAHLHRFANPVQRIGVGDLLRNMDRLGIERTAVSSAQSILCDMVGGNEALARDIAGQDRLLGYVFANPNAIELSVEHALRYLPQPEFIGLKMYAGLLVGKPLGCPEHCRILEAVAEEFPWAIVLFHCGENDPANYPGLVEVARQFPDLVFLAGHMGSKLWRDALPVLATAPNIIAEISAPVPARNRIEDAVRVMGPERVIFGSDFPIIHPAYMLGCVHDADIAEDAKRMILHDNPARILGRLDVRA